MTTLRRGRRKALLPRNSCPGSKLGWGKVLSKRSGALKDTAKLFWKSLRSVAGRRDEKEVQQAVETAQQEAE